MNYYCRLVIVIFILIISVINAQYFPPNTTEIIKFYGYPVEDHSAPTPDGWYLSMQRIPHGINNTNTKGVIYFQHGLTDSSAGSVLNGPEESFPFIFADAGYDVWLGNNRGNGYSMTNKYYTPDQAQFWDFSWDEMAKYDFPSQINYVLQTTGASKITYIGHSEGTIQAFAGFLLDPSLVSKVNLYIALAPVAYVGHIEAILLTALADLDTDDIFEILGINEFYLPAAIDKILPGFCTINPDLCGFAVNLVCGPTTYLNDSRLSYYLHYEPNPTSVKNIAHWAQGVRTDTYEMYDYGSAAENIIHYNQSTPPTYDLTKMPTNLKLAMFMGGEDYLADPVDVDLLLSLLPFTPYTHYEPTYAHLDPLLGEISYQQIYPLMLQLIGQANSGTLPF